VKPQEREKETEEFEEHGDFCYCPFCIERRVEFFVNLQLARERQEENSK